MLNRRSALISGTCFTLLPIADAGAADKNLASLFDRFAQEDLDLSPTTATCPTRMLFFSLFSMGCGATSLPPEVFSSSFLRSVMYRNPS